MADDARRRSIHGYIFVFLAALFWGLIGPVAKFAFQAGVSPVEAAFWRAGIGAALFALHCLIFKQYTVKVKDLPVLGLFGLVGVSLFFSAYQIAVKEGGAALASMLLYTAPVWVALLSRIFFHEPMRPLKLAALAVALGGAVLVSLGGGAEDGGGGLFSSQVSLRGVFFGMLSGFTYALHYVFGKRYLKDYPAATLYCYCLPVGAIGLLPFVDFHPAGSVDWRIWVVFLFMGLFTTYGAYMFYCAGLKRLDATRVAVTANLEPVIAAILAYLWWGERFRPIGYLGGALVLVGVALMVLEGQAKPKQEG